MTEEPKRNGRPRVSPDGEKRTKRLACYITPTEFEAVDTAAKAIGLSRTEYVLQSTIYATEGSTTAIIASKFELAKELIDALVAIRKLLDHESISINQIARKINEASDEGDIQGVVEGIESVAQLRDNNNKLYQQLKEVLAQVPIVFQQERKIESGNSEETPVA